MQNRKNIIPIIELIILCVCQNLTLSGHCYSGKIKTSYHLKIQNENNEGNIWEFVQYEWLIRCDNEMNAFLERYRKIKNISHRSQNDMINACAVLLNATVLINKVVFRINSENVYNSFWWNGEYFRNDRYINSTTLELSKEFLQY